MNLSDIKGIIEINGESFDPRDILQAILNQGLKVHSVKGSLLIGRTFIDPSPNLTPDLSPCPIVDHCKIYDKVRNESNPNSTDTILDELDSDFSSLDIFKPSVSDSSEENFKERAVSP